MPVTLSYGDPPAYEDCKDLGTMIAPETFELSLDVEIQQRETGLIPLFGTPLPPMARARLVLDKLKGKPGNVRVQVKGLGTLLRGQDGWCVIG